MQFTLLLYLLYLKPQTIYAGRLKNDGGQHLIRFEATLPFVPSGISRQGLFILFSLYLHMLQAEFISLWISDIKKSPLQAAAEEALFLER